MEGDPRECSSKKKSFEAQEIQETSHRTKSSLGRRVFATQAL